MVLLKNVASREDVERQAGEIARAMSELIVGEERMAKTCSIGASAYTPDKPFEQLYAEADCAMYQAKRRGRNTLVFYDTIG